MRSFVRSTIQTACGSGVTVELADSWNISTMSIVNDEIAVTQSQHSVPPTECWDYLAERCRGALERGGVPQRRGRTLVAMRRKSEPSVTLLMHIEMQPAMKEGDISTVARWTFITDIRLLYVIVSTPMLVP
eukprot:scaffold34527_cov36-Phaeocystis_antarctica.AAC.1